MSRKRKKGRDANEDVVAEGDILKIINRIVKDGGEDKADLFAEMDHVYDWHSGNKDKIYKGGPVDKDIESDEPRHYPLLWAYVESLTSIIASEISPVFIGKFQQDKEYLGEIGNACFDALRTTMGWDQAMSDMFQKMILYQSCLVGPIIDRVTTWPDEMIGLRVFDPREYYCTRRRHWRNAPERVLIYNLEKSELKMMYPDFAKRIEEIAGTRSEDPYPSGSDGRGDKITLGNHVFNAQKLSPNAIEIREGWIRDFRSTHVSNQQDLQAATQENTDILDGISQGVPPDTLNWIQDFHIDQQHIDRHNQLLKDIQSGDFGPGSGDIVGQTIDELKNHIEDHQYKQERTPASRVGLKYVREDGWRYMIVANRNLVLEDGDNPYLEYGITEPPLAQMVMCQDPNNVTGKSWAMQLIDLNATISSSMNDIEYMLQSHQPNIAYSDGSVDPKSISNDGRVPIKVKKDKDINQSIMTLPAPNLPPQVFEFVAGLRSFLEESAGLYQATRGGRPPGVRSGEQFNNMVQQNETTLQGKPRMIKPELIRFSTWVWQMQAKIGIDSETLKPVIDEMLAEFDATDLGDLEAAPFTIGIKFKSGPTTMAEDRRMIVEQVIPGLRVDFQGLPELSTVTGDLLSEVFGEDMPSLKRGIKKLQAAKQKQIADAQAAAAAQQQAAAIAAQPPSPEQQALAAAGPGSGFPYGQEPALPGGPGLKIA